MNQQTVMIANWNELAYQLFRTGTYEMVLRWQRYRELQIFPGGALVGTQGCSEAKPLEIFAPLGQCALFVRNQGLAHYVRCAPGNHCPSGAEYNQILKATTGCQREYIFIREAWGR
jgi:hypothetical protein